MTKEMLCMKCGAMKPIEKFELIKNNKRRRVCNQCRYIHYIKPSRIRRIIKDSEAKRHLQRTENETNRKLVNTQHRKFLQKDSQHSTFAL